MSVGQNYKYKSTSLNNIFASNASDFNYTQYISTTFYKHNTTQIGPFNAIGNATWQKQSNIPIYETAASITTSITSKYNLVAYYVDYTNGTNQIPHYPGCTKLKMILIGGGGSGGVGGGDDTGQKGTDGKGGGGGALWLGEIAYSGANIYKITVGSGGASVSGGINGSTNLGNPGNPGGATILSINNVNSTTVYANGGSGGPGGIKDGNTEHGTGGVNNTSGATYSNAGATATTISGANSAYNVYYNSASVIYPRLYIHNVNNNWGGGGNGLAGDSNVPAGSTSAGKNGCARVYFIF
jgi:hypothetical protein